MSLLYQWAHDWGVDALAVEDLRQRMGVRQYDVTADEAEEGGEARAQSEIRLEGAGKGIHLWRNNVGALKDKRGVMVRYGLANDSKRLNEVIKSSDLIGIEAVPIRQHMVGQTIGMFVAREVKAPGWVYTGEGREKAQKAFIDLVNRLGGNAAFATGRGSL